MKEEAKKKGKRGVAFNLISKCSSSMCHPYAMCFFLCEVHSYSFCILLWIHFLDSFDNANSPIYEGTTYYISLIFQFNSLIGIVSMASSGLMVFWSRKVGEVEAKNWMAFSVICHINVGLKSLQFPDSLKYNFRIKTLHLTLQIVQTQTFNAIFWLCFRSVSNVRCNQQQIS